MRPVRPPRLQASRGAAAATAALLVTLATLATAVGGIAPVARAAAPLNSASVGVTVSDVHPSTALRSNAPRPVTFFLTLHNNTSRTLRDVSITAVRGDPIGSPARLRQVLASPAKGTGSLLPVPTVSGASVTATLGPGQDAQVVYRTAAGIARGAPLCECADAIYPILFTATFATAAGASTVGAARTYLPVFGLTQPAKVDVGWLWPVLDRPHRLLATNPQDNVFTDDDLTNELAAGGRLDRLLTVVERVSPAVPMTLVVDPELLDEIQVMSTGHYVVRTAGATATVPGAGAAAAADWLGRLRAVLSASPDVEVALTAPADPDVESLTRQNLTWIPTPTPAAQQRIELALGGYPARSDLSWPVGSTLSRAALGRLGAAGVSTVVLNAGNLRGRTAAADVALSPLHASGFSGRAAVTDPTTDSLATTALQVDGQGMSAVPSLVSAVAAHAVEAPNASHYVLIAPSRLLDPDVDAATRAVLATADAFWSTPVTLATATRTITPTNRGTLHPAHLSGALPGAVIAMAKTVQNRLPDLEALFELERNGTVDSSAAIRLLGPLPLAVQRAESSSWRYFPGDGPAAARLVDAQVDHWIRGVRVVRPATGTYTLTSTSAPLPVTLANSLGVPVSVVLDVHTQDGLPGLSTDPPRTIIVDAHSTLQVKVMVHLERTGRLPVEVVLRTPTGRLALGEPLPPLTIHSTAIGTIGTVITVVAAVILALAMVLQAVRRLRTRRRTVHEPVVPPTPVGIS